HNKVDSIPRNCALPTGRHSTAFKRRRTLPSPSTQGTHSMSNCPVCLLFRAKGQFHVFVVLMCTAIIFGTLALANSAASNPERYELCKTDAEIDNLKQANGL